MVWQRHRNSVKNSCSYPGADADSDHNLVKMSIKLKIRKVRRPTQPKIWNLHQLEEKSGEFTQSLETKIREEQNGATIEENWKSLKSAIVKTAEEILGYKERRAPRKPWITEEILKKLEERKKWKSINTIEGKQMYRQLNNHLRRITEKAREDWWQDKCNSIEELKNKGQMDLVYGEIKSITRNRNSREGPAINNKDGDLISDGNAIRHRWKEYLEELYNKDGRPENIEIEDRENITEETVGPAILDSEIEDAIKYMKKRKSAGSDNIPAEFLKKLGTTAKEKLHQLCKDIYNSGEWPEDFCKTTMIPLKKKPLAKECSDHRTISLISHASKIILRILNRRIEAKSAEYIGKSQFGFRKGCGTREAIGMFRTIMERRLQMNKDVFTCFIDFEKAFDRVDWKILLDILKNIGIDWNERRLIRNLYLKQKVCMKIDNTESEPAVLGCGVRQGCIMSPLLFNIYTETIMLEALGDIDEGIKIGGDKTKEIRFADDQVMTAESEEALQKLMDNLQTNVAKYNMKINMKKTKTMRISRKGNEQLRITLNGVQLENVTSMKYLGVIITSDGRCRSEILARIAMAKNAFTRRKELLTRGLSMKTKKDIIRTFIWSIVMYGSESWSLKKKEVRNLEALEMWVWRRMLKISWKDQITNEEVLQRVGEQRMLIKTITRRKKNWLGHIIRGNEHLVNIIEGQMEGENARGRPRITMLDDLTANKSYREIKQMAKNRELWRKWMP